MIHLKAAQIEGRHDLHMALPRRYVEELEQFVGELRMRGRLSAAA